MPKHASTNSEELPQRETTPCEGICRSFVSGWNLPQASCVAEIAAPAWGQALVQRVLERTAHLQWASAARFINPTAALTQLTAKSALLQADSAARLKVRGMTAAAVISLLSGTSCSDHPLAVAGLDCHCSQKVWRRLVANSKGSGINLSADTLMCRARELMKRPANAEIEIFHMKLWNPPCIASLLLSPDTAKLKSCTLLLKRQHNASPWLVFRRAVMFCVSSQDLLVDLNVLFKLEPRYCQTEKLYTTTQEAA